MPQNEEIIMLSWQLFLQIMDCPLAIKIMQITTWQSSKLNIGMNI